MVLFKGMETVCYDSVLKNQFSKIKGIHVFLESKSSPLLKN